jgi:hypothetical protein
MGTSSLIALGLLRVAAVEGGCHTDKSTLVAKVAVGMLFISAPSQSVTRREFKPTLHWLTTFRWICVNSIELILPEHSQ